MINGYSFDNSYEFGHARVVEKDGEYTVVLTIYRRPSCVKTVHEMGTYTTREMALRSAQRLAERRQRGSL